MSKEQIEKMTKIIGNAILFDKFDFGMHDKTEIIARKAAEKFYAEGYRKHGEWIGVEERLPDEQGRFLIVDKEGQMNTAFYSPRFGWFSHFRIKNITHWMPLPEPPKMKGGAE